MQIFHLNRADKFIKSTQGMIDARVNAYLSEI